MDMDSPIGQAPDPVPAGPGAGLGPVAADPVAADPVAADRAGPGGR